jgi:hypothetical protein
LVLPDIAGPVNISARNFSVLGPVLADFVAEVCDCSSKAAGSISRNGSHHPLFAER